MEKKIQKTPAVSLRFSDGTVVETLYDGEKEKMSFAIYSNGKVEIADKLKGQADIWYVPYLGAKALIKNGIVRFPTKPESYESKTKLVAEIKAFINQFIDLHPVFLDVAVYYVLLTWVYDDFQEVPYLRLKGEFGTGKTRFLKVIGSLCYKVMFASGATSTAPIFHMLDKIGGTLLLDEADCRFTDEKADIAKVLNNGNAKGFPVLRCQANSKGEYSVVGYKVYGPKILASRGTFDDLALESRFITQDNTDRAVRADIPTTLPENFEERAEKLRGKLLSFRFENLGKIATTNILDDKDLEGRVKQIFLPLLRLVDDQTIQNSFVALAERINEENKTDRGLDTPAQILRVIHNLQQRTSNGVFIGDITKEFRKRHEADYGPYISSKWVGVQVRKKLNLKTERGTGGRFFIASSQGQKLKRLYDKYYVSETQRESSDNVH